MHSRGLVKLRRGNHNGVDLGLLNWGRQHGLFQLFTFIDLLVLSREQGNILDREKGVQ